MSKVLIFSLLMLCQVICCFALSIIPAFFPPFAREKGISEEVIGFIFISNPIGSVIGSLVIGKILTQVLYPNNMKKNRFTFMIFGLLVQSLGLFIFAITDFQDDRRWIIFTAISARFINGIATASFVTPLYAYIPILYPESTEQKMSISEFFSNLGYLIGPLIGSLLFILGGYLTPFIFFGTLALILVPTTGYYVHQYNKQQVKISEDIYGKIFDQPDLSFQIELNKLIVNQNSLNYLEVISNYRVVVLMMTGFIVNFMFFYFVPIIVNFYNIRKADFFLIQYGSSPLEIGYYFTVMPAGYSINSIISAYHTKHRTLKIFLGCLIMGVSAFFIGPDLNITGVNRHLSVCLIALAIMGFMAAYLFIFTLPILNNYLQSQFPNRILACANMASILFNVGVCMGEIIGPPFAGFMVNQYGYDRAFSILGIVILTFSILYLPILYQDIPSKIHNQRIKTPDQIIILMQEPILQKGQ